MKILLCITLYNSRKFLGKLFYYIHRLNPKPDFTLLIENNSTDGTVEYVYRNYKLPFKMCRLWFIPEANKKVEPEGYGIIGLIRQIALDYFRNHKEYDYLMFLDDDCYPITEDYIAKLTEWNFDLIGAPYTRIYPDGIYLAAKWGTTHPYRFLLKKENQLKYPLDTPVMISGGTMCISRRLAEDKRVNFYPVRTPEVPITIKTQSSEDYGLCLKARHYGYLCYWDTRVKVYHDYLKTCKDPKMWTVKPDKSGYIDFKYE